ncbi:hypothetical protein IMY05_002G0056800 [Salix suchowensis]|nr:hypothetical protein IMY05_002G0056800 [Salix suchowensis]
MIGADTRELLAGRVESLLLPAILWSSTANFGYIQARSDATSPYHMQSMACFSTDGLHTTSGKITIKLKSGWK